MYPNMFCLFFVSRNEFKAVAEVRNDTKLDFLIRCEFLFGHLVIAIIALRVEEDDAINQTLNNHQSLFFDGLHLSSDGG